MFFLTVLLLLTSTAMARRDTIQPHCQEFCGNVSIPYPFGIGPGCYRDDNFQITCRERDDGTVLPFSGDRTRIPFINISVSQNQATMLNHVAYDCYDGSGTRNNDSALLEQILSKFSISAIQNRFTVIGCNTRAYIVGTTKEGYESGCMSFCQRLDNSTSGSCNGIGCCQTSLPENLIESSPMFDERQPDRTSKEITSKGNFAKVSLWCSTGSLGKKPVKKLSRTGPRIRAEAETVTASTIPSEVDTPVIAPKDMKEIPTLNMAAKVCYLGARSGGIHRWRGSAWGRRRGNGRRGSTVPSTLAAAASG